MGRTSLLGLGCIVLLGVQAAMGQETDTDARLRALESHIQQLEAEVTRLRAEQQPPKPPPRAEEEYVVGSDTKFSGRWRDGLGFVVETPNNDYRLHFGGRFDVDAAFFAADQELQTGHGGVGSLDDGANLRRVRLRVDGQVYEIIDFVLELDLAQGIEGTTRIAGATDVYADVTHLPLIGNFRVGHFREPFGMDALTSGNALTFLERSNVWEAFVPFRNLGVMVFDTLVDDRVSWALGVFRTNNRNTGDAFDYGDGEAALSGRVTALPYWEHEGRTLVHLGAACSYRGYSLDAGQDAARYRVFPETRVGRYMFGDTGNLPAENAVLLGAEFAFQIGSLNFQSECTFVQVHDARLQCRYRQPSFSGWYTQVGYFLTGEHLAYRRTIGQRTVGVFDRPVPHENFFLVQEGPHPRGLRNLAFGKGAWEIAARYTNIDLNDESEGVPAQTVQTVTLGLNWYWNANMKVQWNYILADRIFPSQDNRGLAHILAMRFHYDF